MKEKNIMNEKEQYETCHKCKANFMIYIVVGKKKIKNKKKLPQLVAVAFKQTVFVMVVI